MADGDVRLFAHGRIQLQIVLCMVFVHFYFQSIFSEQLHSLMTNIPMNSRKDSLEINDPIQYRIRHEIHYAHQH